MWTLPYSPFSVALGKWRGMAVGVNISLWLTRCIYKYMYLMWTLPYSPFSVALGKWRGMAGRGEYFPMADQMYI